MAEVNAMTNEQLISKTREYEAEFRKTRSQITSLQNTVKNLDARIKENKEKLALST